MTQEETGISSAATIDQLSAVRVVLGNDRLATEYDILISTAIESLRSGPKSLEAIADHIAKTWPDTPATTGQLRSALGAAEAADYVVRTGSGWALSMQGLAEADEARRWAEGVFDRALEDLRARATTSLYPIEIDEARLWLGILVTALFDGIKWAYAALKGEVDLIQDTAIVPRRVDRDKLFASVRLLAKREEVAEFLEACALDAIDASAPFGSEIVSYITTGYLLHAFMARRDRLNARQNVPSLENTTFILDTPLLFSLLDEASASEPIRSAIAMATSVGGTVIVSDHTLSEVQSVLDRVGARHIPKLTAALASPVNSAVLRRLVDEPFVELFVAGLQDGRWNDWAQFRRHVGTLRRILTALHVTVKPHGNLPEDRVGECFSALAKSVARSQYSRGEDEILRDANTIALAWKVRREFPSTSLWPTSWVVTPDTHMNRAYRALNPKDTVGIAIAPSQWVGALSAVVPPASLDKLAYSGAAFVAQETFFRVAARFPPEVAMTVATALGENAEATDVDVRVSQITLDDMLAQYPDLFSDPDAAGATIAASVIAHRSSRVAKAQAHEQKRMAIERATMHERQRTSEAKIVVEQERRTEAEAKVVKLENELATSAASQQLEALLRPRRYISNAAVAVGILMTIVLSGIAIISFMAGSTSWPSVVFAVGTLLTVLLFWAQSRKWVHDPDTSWTVLLAAFLPELVAVFLTLLPYLAPTGQPSAPPSP